MKLSNAEVVAIRNMYEQKLITQAEIAKHFGVSQAYISYVVRRMRRNTLGIDLLAARVAEDPELLTHGEST